VYKSTDGGNHWLPTGPASFTGRTFAGALVIDPTAPTTLYLGTRLDGIFKSDDGGGSWTTLHTGLSNTSSIQALAIDPPRRVASTRERATMARSRALMGRYLESTGLTQIYVTALAIDPMISTTVYAGALFRDSAAYRSTDGGTRGAAWNRAVTAPS